ncbi:hypothetical protein FB451DRAFT_670241 [Mycena latifolia]|nr:hypothetical protein FB451DRAFT_117943 [Mycena latifolia]KAJ7453531.1 hypothetical protein FB451DRAFT_670241 [Mycena latifolia]
MYDIESWAFRRLTSFLSCLGCFLGVWSRAGAHCSCRSQAADHRPSIIHATRWPNVSSSCGAARLQRPTLVYVPIGSHRDGRELDTSN